MTATPFVHPVTVRYFEVDQQRVVFNMWYLAYFDDTMTAFLLDRDLPYKKMVESGYDIQVVHTEIDWRGSLAADEQAEVRLALAKVGRTSFTLQFEVRCGDRLVAMASTVYVSVATDGSGKCEIPAELRAVLGPISPLWE